MDRTEKILSDLFYLKDFDNLCFPLYLVHLENVYLNQHSQFFALF